MNSFSSISVFENSDKSIFEYLLNISVISFISQIGGNVFVHDLFA
ncbi:hypothetical protein [Tenacibaculum finnmarkense]|nr:hypothetical protein [Tenacibaculum finnmarkense]